MFYHLLIFLSVTCLKFLLIPSYFSTDFEVHRNWLAITFNKPLSEWYFESTSKWSLDYPPLFAWFEYGLSQLAFFFDPKILVISAKPYASSKTIFFQRLSVILTDLIYVYAAYEWCKIIFPMIKYSKQKLKDELYDPILVLSFLFLWNPGLLIVDHIHFQYNGLLSGIFLLSIARMVKKKYLESAFWFSILINMKHIYLYVSPIFFVNLLRDYCFDKVGHFKHHNFIKLCSVVNGIFFFSLAPFVFMGQTNQLLSRLFPFKRGLTHAYWAPNFWALYNSLDKLLSIILKKKSSNSMTRGLVEEYQHQVLPNISPYTTLLIVLLTMMPILIHLWKNCHRDHKSLVFVRAITSAAFCSFLFGYHVHEKAILMVILPLTPLALTSKQDANIFIILSTIGTFSLFPLLYKEGETLTKFSLLLLFFAFSYKALNTLHSTQNSLLLSKSEIFYLFLIIALEAYRILGYQFLPFFQKFSFLPLLLTSNYCAFANLFCFAKLYRLNLIA